MQLSEKIKILRKKENLTQEALAEKLYITKQAVQKWENGQSYPDITKLMDISKILNCSVEILLDDEADCLDEIREAENLEGGRDNSVLSSILSCASTAIIFIMLALNMGKFQEICYSYNVAGIILNGIFAVVGTFVLSSLFVIVLKKYNVKRSVAFYMAGMIYSIPLVFNQVLNIKYYDTLGRERSYYMSFFFIYEVSIPAIVLMVLAILLAVYYLIVRDGILKGFVRLALYLIPVVIAVLYTLSIIVFNDKTAYSFGYYINVLYIILFYIAFLLLKRREYEK